MDCSTVLHGVLGDVLLHGEGGGHAEQEGPVEGHQHEGRDAQLIIGSALN